jgi:hypothetical protein
MQLVAAQIGGQVKKKSLPDGFFLSHNQNRGGKEPP